MKSPLYILQLRKIHGNDFPALLFRWQQSVDRGFLSYIFLLQVACHFPQHISRAHHSSNYILNGPKTLTSGEPPEDLCYREATMQTCDLTTLFTHMTSHMTCTLAPSKDVHFRLICTAKHYLYHWKSKRWTTCVHFLVAMKQYVNCAMAQWMLLLPGDDECAGAGCWKKVERFDESMYQYLNSCRMMMMTWRVAFWCLGTRRWHDSSLHNVHTKIWWWRRDVVMLVHNPVLWTIQWHYMPLLLTTEDSPVWHMNKFHPLCSQCKRGMSYFHELRWCRDNERLCPHAA